MRSTKLTKTAQNDWRDVGRPSSHNAFAIATFSMLCLRFRCLWRFSVSLKFSF